jgi:hypothetical protein
MKNSEIIKSKTGLEVTKFRTVKNLIREVYPLITWKQVCEIIKTHREIAPNFTSSEAWIIADTILDIMENSYV